MRAATMHKALPLEGDFERPRALLLGSFPGIQSLKKKQYYAHPRNLFWRLLSEAHGEKCPSDYPRKLKLLKRKRLALCDVLEGCRRTGSLDNAIKKAVPSRAVRVFLLRFPAIPVFFTGKKAKSLFVRFLAAEAGRRQLVCLPSPSPANMTRSLTEKKREWKKAFAKLKQGGGKDL